jgi:glyceraldehyde 3-phosphate dehydrogenase
MAIRFAINGFGRIGRCILRAAIERDEPLEIALINDLDSPATLAHLLQYDSVHGVFPHKVTFSENAIEVAGRKIRVTAEKDPAKLPHKELGIDVVLECTGHFTEREAASLHLKAGAKRVLISAPAKGQDLTIAYGINHEKYDPSKHFILSNASCTTNCLAPVAKVLLDAFGIEQGLMTTIHSYTNDQRILDLPHKDLRRARAAALSMIPTSTGAAKAVSEVIPELKGKLHGVSVRVPTPNVSLVDLTVNLSRNATVEAINAAFKAAAEGPMKGVLQYETALTVSVDYNGNPHSAIFASTDTQVMGDRMAKVFAWYDNEWGFSNRMIDVAKLLATKQ